MKLEDVTLQQVLGATTAVVGALLAFFIVQENSGTDINDTLMLALGALSAMLGALNAFFGGATNMARTLLARHPDHTQLRTVAKK